MKRILLILLLTIPGFAGLSSQEVIDLIISVDRSKSLSVEDQYMPYSRIQAIELNPQLWSTKNYNLNDKLKIDLFDDQSFSSTIDRVNVNVNGTITIRARLDDYPMGYLILSITGDFVLGSVRIPENNELYRITTGAATGDTWLKSIDIPKLDFIEPGPPVIPLEYPEINQEQLKRLKDAARQNPDDLANINVMVVYTPAAASWARSNESSIHNTVAQAMEKAQLVMDNSEAQLTITLAHSAEVNYTESGDSETDLNRLTFHRGFDPGNREGTPRYMDEVHDWRETHGADLVALFASVDDTGGLGWLLTLKRGSPEYAFSMTRVQQASWTYTHIHEIGHNIGCHHHAEQNSSAGPTPWNDWPENSWSAGWRWTDDGNNNVYSSVMTYSSGEFFNDGIDTRPVPYFSNPGIYYRGSPAGDALIGDNTRTIREIKHVIAAYQNTVPEHTLSIAIEGNGMVEVDGMTYSRAIFVKEGATLVLQAVADKGHKLINWTGTGNNEVSDEASYTLTMPAGDLSLTANFDMEDYAVTVNIQPGGAGNVQDAGIYNMDDEVTLEIFPNPDYIFINWTDADGKNVSDDFLYTFTMPAADVPLNANFRLADVHIFPNPANKWFNILSTARIIEVKVIDLTGKVVYHKNMDEARVRIPTGSFQTGIYIVSVRTGNGVFFEKIIIFK